METLALGIESVPGERYLALLMRIGDAFTQGIISPAAMTFGLRLIQSLALTPVSPRERPRAGAELRSFLRRWFGPTIRPTVPRRPGPPGTLEQRL